MPRPTLRTSFAVIGVMSAAALGPAAITRAQIAYTEGTDLTGQSLGTVAAGINTVTGTIAANSTSFPNAVTGDDFDQFSITVPSNLFVTQVSVRMTNLVTNVPSSYCVRPFFGSYAGTIIGRDLVNNTTLVTPPITGAHLGPGTYSFVMAAGLSVACTAGNFTSSYSYVVTFTAAEVPGACCNRWSGSCTPLGETACAAAGLRFDGVNSVCTPSSCSPCPADINASGGLSVQDIFDFLAAYFAGCN